MKTTVLVVFLMFTVSLTAQVGTLNSAYSKAKKEVSVRKLNTLIDRNLSNVYIYNDSIKILRIPTDANVSPKRLIQETQAMLDEYYNLYLEQKKIPYKDILYEIQMIKYSNNSFPTEYYKNEYDKYLEYNSWIKDKENDIRRTKYVAELKQKDSIQNAQLKKSLSTSTAYVVSINNKPIKVYQKSEDCIRFVSRNKDTSYQQVRLYYRLDSTAWQPSDMVLLDEYQNPEPLNDEFLAKKTVYVVLQTNFKWLADRIYENLNEGKEYIDNFKSDYVELPYYFRNKKSYDEVYRIKRSRLK